MIEVSHLTKRYGTHTAIADLSFHIEKGQIYGLLGPNGAGKSTTMNIMTGCLSASSGSVTVGGHDIFEEAGPAKRLLGYLPERPPLYLDRTPWEYLSFVGQAKGVAKEDLDEQIHHVMEVTRIADVSQRLIKNLSKGYQQRVGIAQALLGDPEVVILDEPTASCIYTQKGNKKIRKPQAANQTALIFDRRAAARLLSINSIRRLCWS